jgi:diguanylate cyclase (GGDEF)-like protein
LFAVALIASDYDRQRAQLVNDSIGTARALASAVDSDLSSVVSALHALATSPNFTTDRFSDLQDQARDILPRLDVNNILITDPTGQQRMNSLRTFGEPLPRTNHPENFQRLFETGAVEISDLRVGPVLARALLAIGVPVLREGKVVYILSATISPQRLTRILNRQKLPPGWVGMILDGTGTIIARTQDMDRFVGVKVIPALVRRTQEITEGSLESDSVEGIPMTVVFSGSNVSTWTVAIGIPDESFAARLRHAFRWLIAGTASLLAISLLLSWWIGGAISASIRALVAPALALGFGEPVSIASLPLLEADEVGKALVKASGMLAVAQHAAHHDTLTGLANRALLDEILAQQIAVCERSGTSLAVLYVDLDGFKAINDQHGHASGDELLRAVAGRLKEAIRASDVAGRIGGDEFAVILVPAGSEAASTVARKLVECLQLPYPIGALPIEISASIGVATYPDAGRTGESLLHAADEAMYAAKSAGKRRYALAPSISPIAA